MLGNGWSKMDELAYRIRAAEPDDLAAVRGTITVSLAHPEGRGRGTSLRTAQQRNELLLLERYDAREKDWVIGGFVEFHMRVDDTLTLRDLGTIGDSPHRRGGEALDRRAVLAAPSGQCDGRRAAGRRGLERDPGFDPRILDRRPTRIPSSSLLQHLEVVAGAGSTGTAWRSPTWRTAAPWPRTGAAPLTVRALVRRMMPVIVARSVPVSMAVGRSERTGGQA